MTHSPRLKTPCLSVVLVTDRYSTIRQVMSCYQTQTICDQIEIVIVIPASEAASVDRDILSGFLRAVVVEVSSIEPMPPARAAGVRACSGPIVFIGETHSFPRRGFAAALVEAHAGPWDIVVPGLDNANPHGPRSWAAFLIDYGSWLAGLPASPIPNGPTWNASYKTIVLHELDHILDTALSSGDQLPRELSAQSRRVYFEPRAVIDHVNVESRGWADERYLSGLVVGANRRTQWSVARRALYFLASPLIPFVLLYRSVKPVRLLLKEGRLPGGSIAAIIAGVAIRTFGEAVGYVRGITPEAEQRMEEFELHKLRYASRLTSAVSARPDGHVALPLP